jgi:hypothetical protein
VRLCRVSPLAVGTNTQMSVWFAFIVDQVRSMGVTASAWQSLVAAWGNLSNFIWTVIFPVMTVPLTGLGEFSSSVLPLTCRTIYRTVPGASILFLVRTFGSKSPFNLDSLSLLHQENHKGVLGFKKNTRGRFFFLSPWGLTYLPT